MTNEPIYNLRPGDLLESSFGFGMITKVTARKVVYFYLADKHGRQVSNVDGASINKEELWQHIDAGNATVHYAPNVKYRRKRKKT